MNRELIDSQPQGSYACMKRPQIERGELAISAIEPKYIEEIRLWRNAQIGVLRQSRPITLEEQVDYYSRHIWPDKAVATPKNILFIYLIQGKPIGYGGLVHIAWEHRRAEVSFMLAPNLEREKEQRARLFLTYLELIQSVAFDDLGLERIFTETYATRLNHIRTLEKAGFLCEGRLRAHVRVGEKAVDSIFHGYLASDIRIASR
ncbi:MAG: GNAT family N-acetyltransferase [Halioglobus sp.]